MQEANVHASSPLKWNGFILLSLFFTITSSYLSAQETWLVWPGSGKIHNNDRIDLEKGSIGSNLDNYHLQVIEADKHYIVASSNTRLYTIHPGDNGIEVCEKVLFWKEVTTNQLIFSRNRNSVQFIALTSNGAALVEINEYDWV